MINHTVVKNLIIPACKIIGVVQLLSHVQFFAHVLQHTRLPCPSLSPRLCSNSCPLSQWCHSTISLSVTPFFSFPHFFLAPGAFPMCQLFTSSGQSIGASASVLPMSIQDWIPLGLTGLNSLLPMWLSRVFSSTTVWRHQFFGTQPSLWSNSQIHTWLVGLTTMTSYDKPKHHIKKQRHHFANQRA